MPPVGMNLYVIKRIAPDSSILDIYKGVLVFAVAPLIGASPLFTIFFSFLINHSLETFTIRVILGAVSVVAGTVILFGF
ncbi:MAG: hypothetical protein JSW12_07185 [Deltaproteobacteria bacterium]|nr:MAG: hypothetical protein JSW12_07185 [Deltaproteobacteria bacterium]